jgi:hypothetical protein
VTETEYSQKFELVVEEVSTAEELCNFLAQDCHCPPKVVLVFHSASGTSFEKCVNFYEMIQERHNQCDFLWIANVDHSYGSRRP